MTKGGTLNIVNAGTPHSSLPSYILVLRQWRGVLWADAVSEVSPYLDSVLAALLTQQAKATHMGGDSKFCSLKPNVY